MILSEKLSVQPNIFAGRTKLTTATDFRFPIIIHPPWHKNLAKIVPLSDPVTFHITSPSRGCDRGMLESIGPTVTDEEKI